jgi:hypothetical protein
MSPHTAPRSSRTAPGIARKGGLAVAATLMLAVPFGAVASAEPGNGNGTPPAHANLGQGSAGQGSAGQGNAPAPSETGPAQTGKPVKPSKPAKAGQGAKPGKPGKPGATKPAQPTKPVKPAKPVKPVKPAKPAKPAPTAATADPSGNNGTVKIAPYGEMDGIPQNTPHVGCTFQVEWYGFDEGDDIVSTVSFASQAPTADVQIGGTSPSTVDVGEDPASGAGTDSGLDGVQAYTLSFTGEPHPKQGYHVKLTVHTPRSRGNDTKTKVFWVEGCKTEVPTTPEQPEVPEQPETVVPTETVVPETVVPETPTGVAEVTPTQTAAPEAEVLGVQAEAPVQEAAPTKAPAAVAGAVATVPTVINAGLDAAAELGASRTATWLGLALALAGLLAGGVARVRKSRA